jgi:hypothetical protein
MSKPAQPQEPVISAKVAAVAMEMLSALSYFPREAPARSLVAEELRAMCSTEAQALWLVRRMARLYREWPGVLEMRLVFCSSHRPLDGIEPLCISPFFPDGIPSETPERQPAPRLIAPSSPRTEALVGELTKAKQMGRGSSAGETPASGMAASTSVHSRPSDRSASEPPGGEGLRAEQQSKVESVLSLLMQFASGSEIKNRPPTDSMCGELAALSAPFSRSTPAWGLT